MTSKLGLFFRAAASEADDQGRRGRHPGVRHGPQPERGGAGAGERADPQAHEGVEGSGGQGGRQARGEGAKSYIHSVLFVGFGAVGTCSIARPGHAERPVGGWLS